MAQGCFRYRCFLPDLTGFTVPPCTGPNYQQSTSPKRATGNDSAILTLAVANCLTPIAYPMAEREGFEPSVPLLGVHTISSRAPSTARSPLRFAMSSTYARRPALQFPNVSQMSPRGFSADRLATYQNGRSGAKMNCRVARKNRLPLFLSCHLIYFQERIRPARGFSVLLP